MKSRRDLTFGWRPNFVNGWIPEGGSARSMIPRCNSGSLPAAAFKWPIFDLYLRSTIALLAPAIILPFFNELVLQKQKSSNKSKEKTSKSLAICNGKFIDPTIAFQSIGYCFHSNSICRFINAMTVINIENRNYYWDFLLPSRRLSLSHTLSLCGASPIVITLWELFSK